MTRAFWEPRVTNMGAFPAIAGSRSCAARAPTVWDDAGKALLDVSAALWYCNVGYGRKELADAAARQMVELSSYKTYDGFTSPSTEALALRVTDLVPLDGAKVFFTSGGGESIDTAAKLSPRVLDGGRQARQAPDRLAAVRLSRLERVRDVARRIGRAHRRLRPARLRTEQVPWDDAEALAETIDRVGADRVAAFFAEPVIGAGGVMIPPDGYLDRVQEICRERDVLLVLDEVITGFGRTGEWFATGRYGLSPDLITVAKGITSGYLPLGGVIASARVAEPFWADGTANVFRHGFTYSGHATACAVGLANLDVIEQEGLVGRVKELEPVLADALRPLADHPAVADVRTGVGLLGAVELGDPSKLACRDRRLPTSAGFSCAASVASRCRSRPPFVIAEDELATGGPRLRRGADAARLDEAVVVRRPAGQLVRVDS
jgi:adenosylmethionine-8-amino-7-oxononanoate aminotransferase